MKGRLKDNVYVAKARCVSPYKLEIVFSDAKRTVVDLESFLRSSTHPEIRKYLDRRRFRKFSITHGVLNWNDFDLIFPMADLYSGKVG